MIAGAAPLTPVSSVAVQCCRAWRAVFGGGWSGFDEIAGHDWTSIVQAGSAICRFDSRSWLPEMAVPTAVIATRNDEVVPHRRQAELAAAVPGATLRVVDGGHSACTTNPRRFAAAVIDACVEVTDRASGARSPLAVRSSAA
jgi:pimeloyl-ACP methyl ester carboxylesterase